MPGVDRTFDAAVAGPVTIEAMPDFHLWTRPELIGSSNEEAVAALNNEVPADRIADLKAAIDVATAELLSMNVAGGTC